MVVAIPEKTEFASETDAEVMEVLVDADSELSTRDIADECGRPRSTIYDALGRLEGDDLITREKRGNSVEWGLALTEDSNSSVDESDNSVGESAPDDKEAESSQTDITQTQSLIEEPTELTGEKTREIRENLGLSQLELTAAGQLYQSEIVQWENEETELTTTQKRQILEFLEREA